MDLSRQVAEWGLGLALALGLAVLIQVEFSPPVLDRVDQAGRTSLVLRTDLGGAMVGDLLELVEHAVPVGLGFTARIYLQDGRKTVVQRTSWLQYRSLDRSFLVRNGAGEQRFAGPLEQSARRAIAAWSHLDLVLDDWVDPRQVRYVILEARLDIPGLGDEALVRRLWNGQQPSVTWVAPKGGRPERPAGRPE